MARQTNVLQELRKPTKRVIEEISSDLVISSSYCRHALSLSHGVYCALKREKTGRDTCDSCPHFDPEPLEYRVFRRR